MADRYLIIVGKFNELITSSMHKAALEVFAQKGLSNSVDTLTVPGAFEIPVVAAKAAKNGKYAAVICLGAVIRGETPHFDYVAGPCASGLMNISIQTGVPIIFGVLTTDTVEQALNRAGLKMGNKGADCAHTALSMVETLKCLDA